jgi:uncharacterized glyoxalase superfamily protein PhnB
VVRGAAEAIGFYKRTFGATELARMPAPDGRLMHAEIQIGDSKVMVSDEFPEMGGQSPQSLGGSPVSLFLYVENVDAVYRAALAEGAQEKMPVTDAFWGDRWGALVDPYGHHWQIATHIEDLTPEEIGQRAVAAQQH